MNLALFQVVGMNYEAYTYPDGSGLQKFSPYQKMAKAGSPSLPTCNMA
jgi:hypothetical protein